MARRKKETPLRYCETCGKKLERKRLPNGDLEYLIHFNRRKYCDRNCMAKSFKGRKITDDPSWYTAHKWAREIKKAEMCEIRGSTKNVEIHHKDENWKNNSLENLQALCRSCHVKTHRPKKSCKICGKPQKGLGYCNKHYIRFKKYGDPLFKKNGTESEN